MLACDLVVAGRAASSACPEVKRALVAAGGAALLLPRRITYTAAMELLPTGEPITAVRTAALGLVDRLKPVFESKDAREGAAAFVGSGRGLAWNMIESVN